MVIMGTCPFVIEIATYVDFQKLAQYMRAGSHSMQNLENKRTDFMVIHLLQISLVNIDNGKQISHRIRAVFLKIYFGFCV